MVKALKTNHFLNVQNDIFFSILGMNLFGCKFCDPDTGVCDRKNFDSLLWATVTVFQVGHHLIIPHKYQFYLLIQYHSINTNLPGQVLTQEDWNIVLFAGMERTSHWAALYFVALMTFGNYVLFNLLVAILVEGFSNQVQAVTRLVTPDPVQLLDTICT